MQDDEDDGDGGSEEEQEQEREPKRKKSAFIDDAAEDDDDEEVRCHSGPPLPHSPRPAETRDARSPSRWRSAQLQRCIGSR